MAASQAPESGSAAEEEALRDTLRRFLDASRHHLKFGYPGRIDRATRDLSEEDLWWRPSRASNSIGHLVLHLEGNLRQWIIHGVGGALDTRDRAAEFAAEPSPWAPLRARLDETLAEVDHLLAGLDPDVLGRPRTIQGVETTVLEAIYHVVEHFSMHTGQILWIAKARTGRDLGLYEIDEAGRVTGLNW
ncbi:MAG: DinB family protein [Longimicrobiales bacterium]|nr:DinB family protein [Longimicrobiales bacterium]